MSIEFGGTGFDSSSFNLDGRESTAKKTEQAAQNSSSSQGTLSTQGARAGVEETAKAITELQQERSSTVDSVQAAEALLQVARNLNQDIQFSLEAENIDVPVIKVIDRETGDVIRQIPTDDFLKLAGRMQDLNDNEQIESATGFLIDSRV